ncbi:MAG: undecaprenyl/decaprenyl-phosphate alpha-N-acetylglucosaminyl 1-phosphate transferase [Clostridiales bacterium]|nr:undecaprenyl/decaprenyl-phosphate alpha-N-acetylglucosaminyl 1-phosphate transferase [Clostridiales bacterium]
MENHHWIYGFAAVLFAGLLSFATTPAVRVLAYKIGAIDIPADKRRMHKHPVPRIGGLAIFIAFVATTLVFCTYDATLTAIWIGGTILVALGLLDDVLRINAWVKLFVQIIAALIALSLGVKIEHFNLAGNYINLGNWSFVITMLWIVGLTNAVNFIDGLDGLACGVSTISSLSLLVVTLRVGEPSFALLTAILAASCLGFLPFNSNPAKIFMGDTGALFLGFSLAVISISGVFKTHMILSFMIPIAIFGFPIFDTLYAVIRRLLHGKSPFCADRGHLHHRLVDMGFGQRQSVRILYAVCGILGISGIMLTQEHLYKSTLMIIVALIIFAVYFLIFKNPSTREQSGIFNADRPDRHMMRNRSKKKNKDNDKDKNNDHT